MANDQAGLSSLDSLRRQIDELDDRLHDLIMRRAELVEAVGGAKRDGQVAPFRPGREAQILRRLVARHRGRFPPAALVRLWREMLGGTVAMQAPLSIAVCVEAWDLARDHFGTLAPILGLDGADDVIAAVVEGSVTVGVLPLLDDEPVADPWWLTFTDSDTAHIIARLPFGSLGNAMDGCTDAFVVAGIEADPSGDDCTLLAIATPQSVKPSDITDAFLAVSLDANLIGSASSGDLRSHLVEARARIASGDPRLSRVLEALGTGAEARRLGAYARPLPDAALGGIAPE
jgi:chorismate mutase / prephenate dehydratase